MKIKSIVLFICSFQLSAQQAGNPPATPVVIDTVKKTEVVPTMPITGNIYSQNAIQITASVTGQIAYIAEPGTPLKPGDVIVKMETISLELQKAEQEALISRAQTQLDYLQKNLKRQQDLVKAKTISANAVEQTESQRDVAVSDLKVAELRLAQINDQLQRSEIKANFNGVVSSRLRREGETVAAGTVVAGITDMQKLEIRAQVPLRYAGFIQPGQQLDVFAYGVTQKATVKSIVPSDSNRNQSYELRLLFENQNRLTIGQLVSVSVPMYQARESLVVNQDALVLREQGTYVFKVEADNAVKQVQVNAQENVGDSIAIDGELQAGDQVVIRGADNLQNGHKVEIIKEQG
ncbi:MAG: efflux RND transporter periplasmic adaptor subunit [Marinicella sp.]